ncbi:hypothetical protein DAAJ005_07870 [Deinococcus sp. AJ005]|nr:hypothetical protein DAAJ005_07870 [Deinococcus sp. AJ005]
MNVKFTTPGAVLVKDTDSGVPGTAGVPGVVGVPGTAGVPGLAGVNARVTVTKEVASPAATPIETLPLPVICPGALPQALRVRPANSRRAYFFIKCPPGRVNLSGGG